MSLKKPEPKRPLAEVIRESWSEQLELGGSTSSFVACYAANQVLGTIWRGNKEDPDPKEIRDRATLRRVADIGAHDVIEAMLAVQMVATHEAALECFRRAALSEQTFAGRELGLKYADKLARSFAALTDALNRHRGKGQQLVRVEHVHVHSGGQAIVGAVSQGGGGGRQESEDQPHAPRSVTHEPEPEMRCSDPVREALPVPDGEGQETLPDARRSRRQRGAVR